MDPGLNTKDFFFWPGPITAKTNTSPTNIVKIANQVKTLKG